MIPKRTTDRPDWTLFETSVSDSVASIAGRAEPRVRPALPPHGSDERGDAPLSVRAVRSRGCGRGRGYRSSAQRTRLAGEWALGTVGAVARLRYAVAAAWPRAWAYSASRATSASLGQRNRSPRRAAPAPARSRSAPASKVTRVGPGSAAQNSTTSLVSPDSPNAPTSPRLAVHPHGDHLPGVHVQPTRQRAYLRPPPRRGSGSCRSQRCGAGRRTRSLPRKPCTQTGRRTAPGSTSRPSTARQPPSRPVCRRP